MRQIIIVFVICILVTLFFWYYYHNARTEESKKHLIFLNHVCTPLLDKYKEYITSGDLRAVDVLIEILETENKFGYSDATITGLGWFYGFVKSEDSTFQKIISNMYPSTGSAEKRRKDALACAEWLREKKEEGSFRVDKESEMIIHQEVASEETNIAPM